MRPLTLCHTVPLIPPLLVFVPPTYDLGALDGPRSSLYGDNHSSGSGLIDNDPLLDQMCRPVAVRVPVNRGCERINGHFVTNFKVSSLHKLIVGGAGVTLHTMTGLMMHHDGTLSALFEGSYLFEGKVYDLTARDVALEARREPRWAYVHQAEFGGVKRAWKGDRETLLFPGAEVRRALRSVGIIPTSER